MKKLIFLIGLFLSNIVCAQAYYNLNDCDGAYLSLGIGGFFSNSESSYTVDSTTVLFGPTEVGSSLFQLPNVNWHNKFKSGFESDLALGYRICRRWRWEGEFLYQQMRRDISGSYDWREIDATTAVIFAGNTDNPLRQTSSTVNLYSFMMNGYFDFKNCSPLTPYIGAGIGVSWIHSDGNMANNFLVINISDPPLSSVSPTREFSPGLYGNALAGQFKAGLAYQVTCNTSIALQYRLFATNKFKAKQSRIVTNPGVFGESNFIVHEKDIDGPVTNGIELVLCYKF